MPEVTALIAGRRIAAGGLTAHVEAVARHRNGVAGEPFYVVLFREGGRNFLGTIFEGSVPDEEEPAEPCDPRVAILDRDLLAQGVIGMGENSWRGDQYEPLLRAIVQAWTVEFRSYLDAELTARKVSS